MSPEDLLDTLVRFHAHRLTEKERTAFDVMNERGVALTPKQAAWVQDVGERLGVEVAPARNLFSGMSPQQRAEHQQHVRTLLPWEKPEGVARPLKPPGRR